MYKDISRNRTDDNFGKMKTTNPPPEISKNPSFWRYIPPSAYLLRVARSEIRRPAAAEKLLRIHRFRCVLRVSKYTDEFPSVDNPFGTTSGGNEEGGGKQFIKQDNVGGKKIK